MAKSLLEKALAEKRPSAKAQSKPQGKFATYAIAAIIIVLILVFLAVLQQQANDYLNSPSGNATYLVELGSPQCDNGSLTGSYYDDPTNENYCMCEVEDPTGYQSTYYSEPNCSQYSNDPEYMYAFDSINVERTSCACIGERNDSTPPETFSTPSETPSETPNGTCGWVSPKAFVIFSTPEPFSCDLTSTWSIPIRPVAKTKQVCNNHSDCSSMGGKPTGILGISDEGKWCCVTDRTVTVAS